MIDFSYAEYERFWMHELPRAKHAGPHTLESRCLHNGSDNDRALNVDLRKGVANCFTKCSRGWNMVGWAKHWHGLSDREAMQYVLLHSGHADGRNLLTWNVPLARPVSVTSDDWSLGLLAQNIERARQRIVQKARDNGKPVQDGDYKATGLWAYPAIRAVKLAIKHLPTGRKEMRWFALTGKGGWLWGLKKANLEAPLYRVEEIRPGEPLWLVNGEKATDRARQEGVNATCLPHGEGHWRERFLAALQVASEVWWIADNDTTGASASSLNASRLARAGIQTRLVKLPGLPPKGDFYDWLEAGRSVAEATAICVTAPLATRERIDRHEAAREHPPPPVAAPENNGQPPSAPPPEEPAGPAAPDLLPFPLTDAGNAERLILLADGDICNCLGECLDYQDHRWQIDRNESRRYQRAIQTMRYLGQQARAAKDDRSAAFALRSENGGPLAQIVKLSARHARTQIPPARLDSHPHLIPCQNVVYDLLTGQTRPHRREDYITRLFHANYDPAAPPPKLFLNVLWELMGGHAEASENELERAARMVDYLQAILGYCITGYTQEKALIILYGPSGNNGKSLLMHIMESILGDYAVTVDPRLFTADSSYGDGNRSADLARTRGARLIQSSEPRRNSKLASEIIKRLTGGEGLISGAFKHRDPFQFPPTGKPMLECNHIPALDITDPALFKRVFIVEFAVEVPDERIDRHLAEKLLAERDGILGWLIQGAKRVLAEGLLRPIDAQQTTESIKEASVADDELDDFLADCFDRHPHYGCKLSEAYAAYRAWARKNDVRFPLGRNTLGEHLGLRPFIRRTTASDRTVRLHGITPKETSFGPRSGRDAQYKENGDD